MPSQSILSQLFSLCLLLLSCQWCFTACFSSALAVTAVGELAPGGGMIVDAIFGDVFAVESGANSITVEFFGTGLNSSGLAFQIPSIQGDPFTPFLTIIGTIDTATNNFTYAAVTFATTVLAPTQYGKGQMQFLVNDAVYTNLNEHNGRILLLPQSVFGSGPAPTLTQITPFHIPTPAQLSSGQPFYQNMTLYGTNLNAALAFRGDGEPCFTSMYPSPKVYSYPPSSPDGTSLGCVLVVYPWSPASDGITAYNNGQGSLGFSTFVIETPSVWPPTPGVVPTIVSVTQETVATIPVLFGPHTGLQLYVNQLTISGGSVVNASIYATSVGSPTCPMFAGTSFVDTCTGIASNGTLCTAQIFFAPDFPGCANNLVINLQAFNNGEWSNDYQMTISAPSPATTPAPTTTASTTTTSTPSSTSTTSKAITTVKTTTTMKKSTATTKHTTHKATTTKKSHTTSKKPTTHQQSHTTTKRLTTLK